MNSIIQTGQYGLHQSYQRMNDAAHAIATAPVSNTDSSGLAPTGGPPQSSGLQVNKSQVVNESAAIEENLLELRRQEQVFTASASVVSVGQELVGTLLDDYS